MNRSAKLAELWGLVNRLWSLAADQPEYVRGDWRDLESCLCNLLGQENMPEPTIQTSTDLAAALGQITLQNSVVDFKWRFHWEPVRVKFDLPAAASTRAGESSPQPDRIGWLVWVSFERPDTSTGQVARGRGREEIVWQGTSLSGAVKTCWLLVELMVRHELMEGYRFNGCRIFNPHHTVAELARIEDAHAGRPQ